jgi:hypothetical protein
LHACYPNKSAAPIKCRRRLDSMRRVRILY